MTYEVILNKFAQKQMRKLKSMNGAVRSNVQNILKDISIEPFAKRNGFELLKKTNPGCCSRKVDRDNRVVYQVNIEEHVVKVRSVLGHYSDNGEWLKNECIDCL